MILSWPSRQQDCKQRAADDGSLSSHGWKTTRFKRRRKKKQWRIRQFSPLLIQVIQPYPKLCRLQVQASNNGNSSNYGRPASLLFVWPYDALHIFYVLVLFDLTSLESLIALAMTTADAVVVAASRTYKVPSYVNARALEHWCFLTVIRVEVLKHSLMAVIYMEM